MLAHRILPWALLLFGALPASAQIFPAAQESVFWRNRDLVVASEGRLKIESAPKGALAKDLKIPSELTCFHDFEGFFWANKNLGAKDRREVQLLRSADGSHWSPIATWKVDRDSPGCRIYALNQGYLGVAIMAPFTLGDKHSWMAILDTQHSSGTLKVQRLLDMGVGDRAPFLFAPSVVQIPDGWAAVFARTGHFWLVQEKGAQARIRMLRIFPFVSHKALDAMASVEPPILGCQPMEDGTLLIASRSEEAVLKARKMAKGLAPEMDEPGHLDPALLNNHSDKGRAEIDRAMDDHAERIKKIAMDTEAKVLDLFPEILWWSLDPSSGRFKQIPPPEGAPGRITTVELFHKFRFRPTVKGQLLVCN